MGARSLNKVQLIGNLTRDPELRYTPQGTAVSTIGLATNRSWTTETGEKREQTEFHRLVAWNKLAELCSQLLAKGRKVYFEGRLSTRSWTGQDGAQRTTTEIIIDDMILLDSRRPVEGGSQEVPAGEKPETESSLESTAKDATAQVQAQEEEKNPSTSLPSTSLRVKEETKKGKRQVKEKISKEENSDISPEDIPF